jgi:hypothetical protein
MSEAERHLIAGPRRGSREQQGYDKADDRRTCDREEIPTGQKSEGTRDKTNSDGADGTYSSSIRIHAGGHADEERQCIDCERE